MAIEYFYDTIPKTAEYIDSRNTKRAQHHNFVIEQQFNNTYPAFDYKTKEQKIKFDDHCLRMLIYIDVPIS